MKFVKINNLHINIILFLVLSLGQSCHAVEPKSDVLYFLTSFNSYSSDNYNLKYSPTELSIKRAIDALAKIADNDFVTLVNVKYSKEKIYNFLSIALEKKLKNFDALNKMLTDSKLVEREVDVAKQDDAEFLTRAVKNFRERKNLPSNAPGASIYDVIPTDFEVIKAIASANKYIIKKADREAYLKKEVEFLIKEKQQMLKDLESAFKKLPVPARASNNVSGVAQGVVSQVKK